MCKASKAITALSYNQLSQHASPPARNFIYSFFVKRLCAQHPVYKQSSTQLVRPLPHSFYPFETFPASNIESASLRDDAAAFACGTSRSKKSSPKNGEPDGRVQSPLSPMFSILLIPSCPVNAFPKKKYCEAP